MKTRELLFFSLLALVSQVSRAQIAKWVIHPDYSSLHMDASNAIIIGNNGDETTFWAEKGTLLNKTKDILYAFREGKAVTLKPNTGTVTGFFLKDGTFVKTEPAEIACGYPYFSAGFLLVKQGEYYQFIDGEGKKSAGKYASAYPFNAGLAACYTYEDLAKKKNPLCYYIEAGGKKVEFSLKGKPVGADDVDFISSLTDDGMGIVAIKAKFYYYAKATGELSPMFESESETDKKKQVTLDGDLSECIKSEGDSLFIITAKAGKGEIAEIFLDKLYVPMKVRFSNNGMETSVKFFRREKRNAPKYSTVLSSSKDNDKWSVKYIDTPVTAAIFDEVKLLKDDIAFVRMNNKWGMIDVIEDKSFSFRINNGKPVGFRHRNYETAVRLDMPIDIKSEKTSFEIAEKDKFHIDGTSIDRRDTENGNYVQYNCSIDIPTTLQDTIAEISCNAQISYDGLVSPMIPLTFSAWHVKRFNVDIIEQSNVTNGAFSFTINIDEQKALDETDYPFDVKIVTDSITAYADKLSETRYKITLSSLVEGINEFSVNILEDGCPPQRFPFEVAYTKPVAKSRNKKAVDAKAVVRKKTPTKSTPKPTVTPHMHI